MSMIRSLCGTVLDIETSDKNSNHVLLDVNGLGFDILCSRAAVELCEKNNAQGKQVQVRLVTYLQIAESGVALYGFASELEREMFLKFLSIKGIGGRTGMAILSSLSVSEVARAVSFADVSAFSRVPGIGRKTAERLCFELKNLMADMQIPDQAPVANGSVSGNAAGSGELGTGHVSRAQVTNTVMEALMSLGFQQGDARQAIAMVKAARGGGVEGEKGGGDFDTLSEEELLRLALKTLHRR